MDNKYVLYVMEWAFTDLYTGWFQHTMHFGSCDRIHGLTDHRVQQHSMCVIGCVVFMRYVSDVVNLSLPLNSWDVHICMVHYADD